MYSLHLTGNPWFLLLIPPGLWILWRQYRGPAGSKVPEVASGFLRASGASLLLFTLQALVLAMLAFSLTGPELRRHQVEFHNPAVLILRDQSASFRNGAYLGLGERYRDYEDKLTRIYRGRNFDVRVADFAETAWPVAGFAGPDRPPAQAADAVGEAPLTSLAALADFVDSAAIPNLQAAFLFSDGRSNLDSGRASPHWRLPLYPVIFTPDSIGEIQPEAARLSLSAPGGAVEVQVAWRWVGKASDPTFKILQGNKTLLTRKLTSPRGRVAGKDSIGSHGSPPDVLPEGGTANFSWVPEKPVGEGREPLLAVLQPSDPTADFDPYNDTLSVSFPQGRAGREIHVLRPVRSLDEKGMLGILQSWEGTRVSFFGAEDIGRMELHARDQVWVEAGALDRQSRLLIGLQGMPAQVVIYSLAASGGRDGAPPRLPGPAAPWLRFSPDAAIQPGTLAGEAFPDEAVRLKNLTAESVDLPEASGMAWVEAVEGGKRGMLMGRIPLGPGKRAFFFALPAIWGHMFDPQGDFTTRENVSAFVKAAQALAGLDDAVIRVSRPARAYHRVPFDLEIRLPEKPATGTPSAEPYLFSIQAGNGFSRQWPQPAGKAGARTDWTLKDVALPRGKYRLELHAGSQSLWHDSLESAPKAALELARIGFDRAALEDAATQSGGAVIAPSGAAAAPADSAEVTSMLPNLPAAQIRMEKTGSIRLYNTLAQCLFALAFLSLSWFLRKKWDLD